MRRLAFLLALAAGAVLTLKEYLTRLGASSTDPVVQTAVKTGTVPGMFLAFQVLTTIIFFSALLSILYYLGIMQKVVIFFAKIMEHTMRVSGAEALSNSACSLVPNQDRYAVTVEIDLEGPRVRRSAFHRSVIRSDR